MKFAGNGVPDVILLTRAPARGMLLTDKRSHLLDSAHGHMQRPSDRCRSFRREYYSDVSCDKRKIQIFAS